MSSSLPRAANRMASKPQKMLESVMRFGKRNNVLPSSSLRRLRLISLLSTGLRAPPGAGRPWIHDATAAARFRPEIGRPSPGTVWGLGPPIPAHGPAELQILANSEPASYDLSVRFASPRIVGALL